MEKSLDVSIIIVNYNTKDLTRNCLKSVFEQTKDISFEVIVSDNGSTDGSLEMIKSEFPQVVLIENNENLGFGAANNRGLDVAKGKYIFYLNSDTVLLNNAVKLFFDYWENSNDKQIGALGTNLLDENGCFIHSYGKFPSYKKEIKILRKQNLNILINEILSFFHIPNLHKVPYTTEVEYSGEVDYITGADLFCQNNEFARFDEKFFLYFEETDLQYRMYQSNLKRIIITGPEIIHLTGQSNNAKKESIFRYISFSSKETLYSRLLYFMKNNYDFVSFLQVYILSVLYLIHIPFVRKTKDIRGRIKKLLKSALY